MRMRDRNRPERRAAMAARANAGVKAEKGRTTTMETPLSVRTLGVEIDEKLRVYLRQRLGFKLGKFAPRTRRVSVRLVDESGPKGRPTFICRMKVVLDPANDVVVEESREDLHSAIDGAMDRAERSIRRALEKVRDQHR